MIRSIHLKCLFVLLALVSVPASGESLNDWLNARIQEQVVAALDKTNGATKQTGTLSASENPTSLVDQSSAADLFSLALNQAGLSIGDEAADSASASATIYALYAAFRGADPLQPAFYNQHARLRRISLSVGIDEAEEDGGENEGEDGEEQEGEGDGTASARLYGLKWLVYDRRQPTASEIETLRTDINNAGFARGDVGIAVRAYLFTRPAMQQIVRQEFLALLQRESGGPDKGCLAKEEDPDEGLGDKIERLLSRQFNAKGRRIEEWSRCENEYWPEWVNAHAGTTFDPSQLSEADLDAIEQIIAANLDPLAALSQQTQAILDRVHRAPQLSFLATYKDLPGSSRVYLGEAIYDYGLADRLTLTLNAGYESTDAGEDGNGNDVEDPDDSWKLAGQFRYQLTPETLTRKASYFDVASEAKRIEDETTYKIQAKTTFPWIAGITIPLSLTYASDAELIDEDEIRGQLGFSIDLSKLVESLRSGALFGASP